MQTVCDTKAHAVASFCLIAVLQDSSACLYFLLIAIYIVHTTVNLLV